MQPTEKILILKDRDLNAFFSDGLLYIRQNFKVLFFSYLYFTGPIILVVSLLSSYSMISTLSGIGAGSIDFGGVIISTILTYLLTILINLILIGMSMGIFKLYELHGPGGFTVEQVWKETRSSLGKITGVFIVIFLIILIPAGIIIGLVALLTQAGPAAAVLFALMLFIGGFLALPLGYFFFAPYPARILEGFSVGDAVGRAWNLMVSKYWYTWVIVLLLVLMMMVISMVVALPLTLIMQLGFMSGLSDGSGYSPNGPIIVILQILISLVTYFIYPFFYSMFTFHHFNLVEKAEGTGTLRQLEELGKPENEDPA